jgi:hypothetical protein
MSLEDVRDFEKRMQEETNEKVRHPSLRRLSVIFFYFFIFLAKMLFVRMLRMR